MGFCEDIRSACHAVVADARHVTIDPEALSAIAPGAPPRLDPVDHFLEGSDEAVATYVLALDAVNFGSGWFAELLPGFGYETVARGLATWFRAGAAVTPAELREIPVDDVAGLVALEPEHPLAGQFTRALHELGAFLADGGALAALRRADGSAERLASQLSAGMPMWRDPLAKRAQLAGSDLALAGLGGFTDLGALTVFADNLVPHVLRRDGALVLEPALAAHLDAGRELPPGREELELRAASVVAGEQLARQLGVTERDLDGMLWQRGQDPRYADPPPHRTKTTSY